MIANSGEALQAVVFQTWASDTKKDKDRNKKIRALEKTFGAQDRGLQLVVLTSWQPWAVMEARKKKAKQHSMKSAIKSITGGQSMLMLHLSLAWARVASLSKIEKLGESSTVMTAKLDEAVEQARIAIEEDLSKVQKEAADIAKDIAAVNKEREETKTHLEDLEGRLEQSACDIKERDRRISAVANELHESKRKARDIGDELSKVGIFLSQTARNKRHSDGRPRSGVKNGESSTQLPRIDNNSRPGSGSSKGGSKSARGVAGERVNSARRKKPNAEERRYLDDTGPYTYAEFLEILAPQGMDFALEKWQVSLPAEQAQEDY
jgi:hypothetical protein